MECAPSAGYVTFGTISVQRGGQYRYMTTSVHMRSISVQVISAVQFRCTLLYQFRYMNSNVHECYIYTDETYTLGIFFGFRVIKLKLRSMTQLPFVGLVAVNGADDSV